MGTWINTGMHKQIWKAMSAEGKEAQTEQGLKEHQTSERGYCDEQMKGELECNGKQSSPEWRPAYAGNQ